MKNIEGNGNLPSFFSAFSLSFKHYLFILIPHFDVKLQTNMGIQTIVA